MTDLVRWSPAREMLTLRDEMDRLFDDFFGAPSTNRQQNTLSWGIPVDVREDKNGYQIEATLPGANLENIDISINGNVLTISAQTNSAQEQTDQRYHLRERRFGRFSRTITFPQGINPEAIQADYENGILKILAPKSEEAKPRRISIGNRTTSQDPKSLDSEATSAKEQTMVGQTTGEQTIDNHSDNLALEMKTQIDRDATQANGNQTKRQ
ncbi:hypothetical protein BH10CHL1_BH10CHL1_01040 [soil metagenome]